MSSRHGADVSDNRGQDARFDALARLAASETVSRRQVVKAAAGTVRWPIRSRRSRSR
jgi:hypothetical protein